MAASSLAGNGVGNRPSGCDRVNSLFNRSSAETLSSGTFSDSKANRNSPIFPLCPELRPTMIRTDQGLLLHINGRFNLSQKMFGLAKDSRLDPVNAKLNYLAQQIKNLLFSCSMTNSCPSLSLTSPFINVKRSLRNFLWHSVTSSLASSKSFNMVSLIT
uniref:Uncharacterized protein n=1 Tax=Romanomermis culicivorax TaxID=13658 RepID=A0A915KJG9_ROMCU